MTELERHLLTAFERLESDYSTRERALHSALSTSQEALNARLDDTTKRLELMTTAYTGLLRHIDDLSSQLAELQRLLTV